MNGVLGHNSVFLRLYWAVATLKTRNNTHKSVTEMRWDEMGWDAMRCDEMWYEMRCDEMRWRDETRWDEMRCDEMWWDDTIKFINIFSSSVHFITWDCAPSCVGTDIISTIFSFTLNSWSANREDWQSIEAELPITSHAGRVRHQFKQA